MLEGEFAICSNIGQYRLPYRFEIERTLVRTSREIIESLEKFTALAKKDFRRRTPCLAAAISRQCWKGTRPSI